ncbi:MAG TPA: aspartate aminotransferase family protein [Streptosporangiaceae bacterium]
MTITSIAGRAEAGRADQLLTIDDVDRLSQRDIRDLYAQYVNRSQASLLSAFGFGQDVAVRAQGCWIELSSGRRILDATGGLGVLNHGHNHPRILAARRRFQEQGRMEVHKSFLSPYVAALSANVARLLPGDLNISYFPNSGAEAVEGALKLAYKYHGGARRTVLHSDLSFHGKLLAAASITGSPENHFDFPGLPHRDSFTYDDIESVRSAVARHTAPDGGCDVYALIVEPYSASMFLGCSKRFLRELRELCTANDIVLIFDEVYTGWGKTGSLFNFMRCPGLVPDVLVMSKSFGGGKASISGYVARDGIFRKAYDNLRDATLHSSTYNGFGEETVTAMEAVAIIVEDDYPARARAVEARLGRRLAELRERHPSLVRDVRGTGALFGVGFQRGPMLPDALLRLIPSPLARDRHLVEKLLIGAVMDALYVDHGILTFVSTNREPMLMIAPSLVVSEAEMDLIATALEKVLSRGRTELLTRFIYRRFRRR